MNQQTQGMSSLSSPDPSMKRKRGRPRKDETLVHGESMNTPPGSENLKKTKQEVGTGDDVENEMVGQVVTGVIEGSFDAGYLLNVRVADTDTQLRGVVFLAGKVAPITPANDIAPHIKMCKRKDLPIPAANPQSQVYGSASPPEQSKRQPVEVKSQIPTVPAQTQSCVPQPGIAESFDKKSFSVFMPPNQTPSVPVQTQCSVPRSGFQESLLDNKSFTGLVPPVAKLPKIDAGSSLPHKVSEPGIDSHSPPAMAQSEGKIIIGQDKVLEEVKAVTMMEGSNGVAAIKVSETETASEPVADISCIGTADLETQQNIGSEKCAVIQGELKSLELELNQTPVVTETAATAVIPDIDTVGTDPELQAQAGDPENSGFVHKDAKSLNFELNQTSFFAKPAPVDVVKTPSIELNQTPVFSEPACVSSDKPVDSVMEEQDDSAPKPVNNVMEEQVYSAQKPVNNAMEEQVYSAPMPVENVMEEQAYSAPKPSQMFGGEIVPTEPKLAVATEGSIRPEMVEPQISSSDAISNMDCDVKDAIPPAQS